MADGNQRSGLEFLKAWGGGLTNWTERWIPDALVIVWVLSIITFIMATSSHVHRPSDVY
jgi:short subunit fatty acids transporter